MTKVAVLVPAPDYPMDWDWAYDVEAAALERAGIMVEPRTWTDPGELSEFDMVLPLVAWGYQSKPCRWFDLLDQLERDGKRVVNSVPVLRWNTDKAYLEELAAAGVPTVPTRQIDALDDHSLAAIRPGFGPDLVIKPPISASAFGTHRLGPSDPIPAEALGRPMMVQPFLRSVMNEGEYSLMFFDGQFSHAIIKRAKSGDYRVQPHLGGTESPCDPPSGSRAVAEAALAAAPDMPTYARVDLIRLNDGDLAVIELELIEPSLWLEHAPDGGASFAQAVLKRAAQQELAQRRG
jgi:glutathione synthase/RimK-type ligase-like ATP-grasp enzyme